jgi:cytochrome c oxidase subunit IV
MTTTEVHETADEVHADHGDGHGEHVEHPDKFYAVIALVLAGLTAAETSTYWIDFGPVFLPLLLTLMVIKFVMVVLFFMHLRFDSKWFNMAFWTGLGLAIACYTAALATFRFFA